MTFKALSIPGYPRMGSYCALIWQKHFWKQADADLRWLIHNHGPTKRAYVEAIYSGLGFDNFLASLECPNGCAQLPFKQRVTRICMVCQGTGKTTPAKARRRVEFMQREFFRPRIEYYTGIQIKH